MPRNMSFAMTTDQFRNRTKDVTRRFGWWFLKPGDLVMGVEKAMGLQKGQQIVRLGLIEIVSTRAGTVERHHAGRRAPRRLPRLGARPVHRHAGGPLPRRPQRHREPD